ncbi:MAG: hypothetical protein D6798_02955 [Deltaproteobacteria bacterium]|nr:MAG: hypothetical protein D6798_02955 [Deltaproteobacteria bacterium]
MPLSIAVAASVESATPDAVEEIRRSLAPVNPSLVVVFHSTRHAAEQVARLVRDAFPGATTLGCSTTGEIGDGRLRRGAMSAMAFGRAARAAVEAIPDVASWRYEDGPALLSHLAAGIGAAPTRLRPDRHLLIVLADGLSGGDELLLTSLRELAPGLEVVGGNAADDNRFEQTWTFCNGVASPSSGVVALVEPGLPFHAFAVHHYQLRGEKLVVTRSDPARRRVGELNGFPAVDEFCRVAALDPADVRADPSILSSQPVQLALRAGMDWVIRGAMAARGSDLVLAGSVEEGAILEVVEGGDLVGATMDGVDHAIQTLDAPPQAMLLFDCGGRWNIAARSHLTDELAAATCPVPAAGMATYGEMCRGRLLNYTLTGVVFGHPVPAPARRGAADGE